MGTLIFFGLGALGIFIWVKVPRFTWPVQDASFLSLLEARSNTIGLGWSTMKNMTWRELLMINCVLSLLIGAACSKAAPPQQQGQTALPDQAAEVRIQQREAAWAKIEECFADDKSKSEDWADARNSTLDLKSECAVLLMWNRHSASLVTQCLSLIAAAEAQGLADERFVKKKLGNLGLLQYLKSTTEADSADMKKCKKWATALLAQPVQGPPALSVSKESCPSSGQVLRDAVGRYAAVCRYTGSCSAHLGVVSRTPDPYDHTRCDTRVGIGRSGANVSAMYRRSGGDWQLVDIN